MSREPHQCQRCLRYFPRRENYQRHLKRKNQCKQNEYMPKQNVKKEENKVDQVTIMRDHEKKEENTGDRPAVIGVTHMLRLPPSLTKLHDYEKEEEED